MSPDSVVLEVAVVHFPESSVDGDWWRQVDEQALPHELRQRLADNGFRSGVIRGALPESLREQLDRQRAATRDVDPENGPGIMPTSEQRLQIRAGKRSKILLTEVQPSLAVLLPDSERISGRTLSNAQCLFSVRSYPQGDGRSEVELVPEIEHGEARQKWVGQAQEGTFRLDANRERLILESLRIRTLLAPGQLLVVSSATANKGLGRQFCSLTSSGPPETRVLLVRLAQTQIDDLFSEQTTHDPLTTPLD
ncbi:MAG: hypothetical protein U0935_14580 [Pirellulales bacterium]